MFLWFWLIILNSERDALFYLLLAIVSDIKWLIQLQEDTVTKKKQIFILYWEGGDSAGDDITEMFSRLMHLVNIILYLFS